MAQVARQEVWRLQYRSEPYLRDLPNDDLLARAGDLATAMSIYSADGKLAIKPMDAGASEMEHFAHVLEELNMRCLSYKQSGVLESLNLPKSPRLTRACQVLAGRSWADPILVKFGKRRHMVELLLEGKGRISPASFYDDPSLGRARSDNEVRVDAYVHPIDAHRFMGVRQEDGASQAVNLDVPYLGSVKIQVEATTDFYVYCMAEHCDARMFEDFDDTCIVITRPDEFKSRIQNALAAKLPGWKFIASPVIYFDPFFARAHEVVAHLYKHFRFSYQKEHRLLWLPPHGEEAAAHTASNHIIFEVGPLTDCAELIWL